MCIIFSIFVEVSLESPSFGLNSVDQRYRPIREESVAGGSQSHFMKLGCWCALISVSLIVPITTETSTAIGEDLPLRSTSGVQPSENGSGSKELRDAAVHRLPMQRLTRSAQSQILKIVRSPTIYRRLPTQVIDCEQDMFLFLTRKPEVLVGIWDLMGITNVQTKRTGAYQLEANDGSGTTCKIDLVYGDPTTHIYVASGSYDGKMVARPIQGSGVFIVSSRSVQTPDGRTMVTGTIDCFLQLDSLGADLIARTLSGLIGRSADKNFAETARFMGQVSNASQRNPVAMLDVADRMPQVDAATRKQFADVIEKVAMQARKRVTMVSRKP